MANDLRDRPAHGTRRWLRTCALGLLSACSGGSGAGGNAPDGGGPADPDLVIPRDGTRLKVRWAETLMGRRISLGLLDSRLGVGQGPRHQALTLPQARRGVAGAAAGGMPRGLH